MVLSNIPGAAGGFLAGFEPGYRLEGQEINWSVFGAGIVLAGFSIPIDISARKMQGRLFIFIMLPFDKYYQ